MGSINDILDNLEVIFPDAIRNYFFFRTRQTHKERWLPEMTEKDFKK